jgi:post-segregation antitoxin (ccd killing protein)
MCKFASFVLTKDREFWSETGDSHNDIIRENNLTELKADAADYIDASGCTALTELKADAADYIDASGCTALTELKADAADYIDASGCNPNLKIKSRRGATIYR